jgi:hypothetical protein
MRWLTYRDGEGDIGSVIGTQARTADRHAMRIAFAAREIEHVAHDHVFVGVVRAHAIGRMNRFVVETFEIDRVRAIDSDLAGIDVAAHGTDQTEIFVLR